MNLFLLCASNFAGSWKTHQVLNLPNEVIQPAIEPVTTSVDEATVAVTEKISGSSKLTINVSIPVAAIDIQITAADNITVGIYFVFTSGHSPRYLKEPNTATDTVRI